MPAPSSWQPCPAACCGTGVAACACSLAAAIAAPDTFSNSTALSRRRSRTGHAHMRGTVSHPRTRVHRGALRWCAPVHRSLAMAPATGVPTRLARKLSAFDAVVVGLGAMIGAGVFAVVGPAAQAAGSGLLAAL